MPGGSSGTVTTDICIEVTELTPAFNTTTPYNIDTNANYTAEVFCQVDDSPDPDDGSLDTRGVC